MSAAQCQVPVPVHSRDCAPSTRTVLDGTGGRTTGEQKLNGRDKTKATLARVMGYVEQNDIHTPALTVVESLRFSAHLRLDRNVDKRSEISFVDNVSFQHYGLFLPVWMPFVLSVCVSI